jgi:uncharacterized protein YkwD
VSRLVLCFGWLLAVLVAGGCGSGDSDGTIVTSTSGASGARSQAGTGGQEPAGPAGATSSETGGASSGGEAPGTGGELPGTGGEPGPAGSSSTTTGGAFSGGGPSGTGGETVSATGGSPSTIGAPCGEGWGTDPIPGNVDLGLASNPETNGVNGGTANERAIFDQLNAEREAVGLAPLGWSDQVANVARSHAADMNQLGYFDHGSSTRVYRDDSGQTFRDNWLPLPRLEFVYPGAFSRAGENIASTRDPVGQVISMWMDSEGHRAAILDDYGWTATHGGIGVDGSMVVFSPAECSSQ